MNIDLFHDAGVPSLTKELGAARPTTCGGSLAHTISPVAASPDRAAQVPSLESEKYGDRELLDALAHSKLFSDHRRAFTGATGLPIALQPLESFQMPHDGCGNENPFCALLVQKSRSCGHCLNLQAGVKEAAKDVPHAAVCPAGLSETAVPVRLGNRLIGFLQTGQVFRNSPTERQFQRTLKWLQALPVDLDREALRAAYFKTRVLSGDEHGSATQLLSIFAQHLSILSNQILISNSNVEPPWTKKAKAFIREHQTESLRYADVAKFVGMSPFHFSKLFRQRTGLTFTHYLSRVRSKHSKDLLLKPDLRVSEIAYDVGFESVTHFNRVFGKLVGQSPTAFRCRCRAVMGRTNSSCHAKRSWHRAGGRVRRIERPNPRIGPWRGCECADVHKCRACNRNAELPERGMDSVIPIRESALIQECQAQRFRRIAYCHE